MFRLIAVVVVAYQLSFSYAPAQTREDDGKTPVIAESGGVEVSSIKVVREKASDAAKGADLTYMELDLWFGGELTKESGGYLVHVTELAVIEDDTGKELSPKDRRDLMSVLKAAVPVRESAITRGKAGPVLRLKLDAPERTATHLKSVKGRAVVSQPSFERLQFKDLASMQGESLEHASLADFPVRVTVKVEDGQTNVMLEVPTPHERLVAWGLVQGNRMISPSSEGEGPPNAEGISTLDATYEGDLSKDCTLGLMLAQPNASRVFEFDFKDVELP